MSINYEVLYYELLAHHNREIIRLHTALSNYYNSHCGQPKICGHEFHCICPSDLALGAIESIPDYLLTSMKSYVTIKPQLGDENEK